MKRLIALDTEEYNALSDILNASGKYLPSYQTLSLPSGFYYVFDSESAEEVEKLIILGVRAGLVSP